jgi:hypothetical protein
MRVVLEMSPKMETHLCFDIIKTCFGQYCNHVVVNRYSRQHDQNDFLFDDATDCVSGSRVVTVLFGATRCVQLKKVKKAAKRQRDGGENDAKERKHSPDVMNIRLQNGSMYVLGSKTKEAYRHSIVRTLSYDPEKGARGEGGGISLTFRSIKTMIDKSGTVHDNYYKSDGAGK